MIQGVIIGSFIKRPCRTEPPCDCHSVELIFAQWFETVLALTLVCGRSQDTQLAGSPKKIGACNLILTIEMVLVPKHDQIFALFA